MTPGASRRRRWAALLAEMPGSTADLAARAGVQPETARRDLRRMRDRGLVEGDGCHWERAVAGFRESCHGLSRGQDGPEGGG